LEPFGQAGVAIRVGRDQGGKLGPGQRDLLEVGGGGGGVG
jgi:hypothetical protein